MASKTPASGTGRSGAREHLERDGGRDAREQRWRARRIARLLAPAAAALGGFASAEARVDAGLGIRLHPEVCVALGEAPYDGVLSSAPALVVVLGSTPAVGAWLALGAEVVWASAGDRARRFTADGEVMTLPPGARLDAPGYPGLELDAAEVLKRRSVPSGTGALRSGGVLR